MVELRLGHMPDFEVENFYSALYFHSWDNDVNFLSSSHNAMNDPDKTKTSQRAGMYEYCTLNDNG